MNHWKDDITNEEYHKDKEHVSSSGLKLLEESTADIFYDRIVLGNSPASTEAMNLSSLVHHAVLEGEDFIKRYAVMPKYDLRKTEDKLKKERWVKENAGKVFVKEDQIEVIQGTYEAIFKHPDAAMLLKSALFERSGYYTDPATGIKCRIRYDAYDPTHRILVDLKAVEKADSVKFAYALRDYRWDLSMAMYGQGILEIDDQLPDDYVFIAVEKSRPYRCAVYQLGPRSLEAGLQGYRSALAKLKECREKNLYPSLQTRYESIELPYKFLEQKNV